MKTKIKSLIAVLLLWAASVTILFGSPNTQPSGVPQTAPEETMPGIVSTSSDNGGMHTRADTVLPSTRYGSQNRPEPTQRNFGPLGCSFVYAGTEPNRRQQK